MATSGEFTNNPKTTYEYLKELMGEKLFKQFYNDLYDSVLGPACGRGHYNFNPSIVNPFLEWYNSRNNMKRIHGFFNDSNHQGGVEHRYFMIIKEMFIDCDEMDSIMKLAINVDLPINLYSMWKRTRVKNN